MQYASMGREDGTGDVKVAGTEERPGEIHHGTSLRRGGATEDEAPHSSPLGASGVSVLPRFSTSV